MSAGRNKNNKTRLRKSQRKKARRHKGERMVKQRERQARSLENQQRLRKLSSQTKTNSRGTARILRGGGLGCLDCGEAYGSPRFPDFIIDDDAWRKIAPNHDEGGLLCPNCICARLEAVGCEKVGHMFTTGPFDGGARLPLLKNHSVKGEVIDKLESLLRAKEQAVADQRFDEAKEIVVEYHKLLHAHIEDLIADARSVASLRQRAESAEAERDRLKTGYQGLRDLIWQGTINRPEAVKWIDNLLGGTHDQNHIAGIGKMVDGGTHNSTTNVRDPRELEETMP